MRATAQRLFLPIVALFHRFDKLLQKIIEKSFLCENFALVERKFCFPLDKIICGVYNIVKYLSKELANEKGSGCNGIEKGD